MDIKNLKSEEKGAGLSIKGVEVVGITEPIVHKGIVWEGKQLPDYVAQSIHVKDSTGDLWIGLKDNTVNFGKGDILNISGIKISPDKKDVTKRYYNFGGKDSSIEVVKGNTPKPAPEAVKQPANSVKQQGNEPVKQDVWDAKDRRMVKMNALSHAVELYKLESPRANRFDAIMSVKTIADELVDYVYNGTAKDAEEIPF